MENKKQLDFDDLIKKYPNKYELTILVGKVARQEYLMGVEKYKIMNKVFTEVMRDDFKVKHIKINK